VAAVRGMALGPTLSIRDVCDRLEKAGYREFQEVEWDDGLYKVKATASDGRFVKLYVTAAAAKCCAYAPKAEIAICLIASALCDGGFK
jgi:hypothetical protein